MGGVVPGEQFVDAADLVIGDAFQHPGEPGLRVNTVELGRFGQGKGDGHGLAAAFRTGEQPVFASKRHGFRRPLDGVAVQFQDAIVQIGARFWQPV